MGLPEIPVRPRLSQFEDLMIVKNMKRQYRRKKKRLLMFKSGSGGQAFVPKWDHFQHLSWMMQAKSCSNLDISFSSSFIHDKVNELQNVCKKRHFFNPDWANSNLNLQWRKQQTLTTVTELKLKIILKNCSLKK